VVYPPLFPIAVGDRRALQPQLRSLRDQAPAPGGDLLYLPGDLSSHKQERNKKAVGAFFSIPLRIEGLA
jgi:hypothetical protein